MYIVYNPKNRQSKEYPDRPTIQQLDEMESKGYLMFDDYISLEMRKREDEQAAVASVHHETVDKRGRGRQKGYKHCSATIDKMKEKAQQKREFKVALKDELEQIEIYAKALKKHDIINTTFEILSSALEELKTALSLAEGEPYSDASLNSEQGE